MDIGVLGPLELHAPGTSGAVRGARQRALFAALVAHRGRTVGHDLLVDTLWPHDPPTSASHTLQTHVSRLRRTLALPVRASDGGYRLDLAPAAVDSDRFDALLAEAHTAEPTDAVLLTQRALALWRGPAYGSTADLPAVRGEASRLEAQRLVAREELVNRLVVAGRTADAVTAAEALVGDQPARESAWTGLIRALVAAGRPADGTTAFQRAVTALAELGLAPSESLRSAHAEALGAKPSDGGSPRGTAGSAAGEIAPPGRVTTAMPLPPTSLVGREDDVAHVERLLDGVRLVTLVGPGGVGKTRLALEVARRRVPRHASGGRVLELTTLADPASVGTATLAALGLRADGGPIHDALRRAGDLDVLVVVDNCEHLVEPVAEMVESLLAGSRARVLATSRERLGVEGEHVRVVAPLTTAGDHPAARQLFLDRATAHGSPEAQSLDLDVVDRLVRALDGLPLAIEMAAARTATMSLTELATMLGPRLEGPDDATGQDREPSALDLLRHPHRRGVERHRTLRAVIAWSQALLDQTERDALSRWPVFAGPVDGADAAAVLGARRDTVEGLVSKSLLLPLPDPATGRTRYRMLHTVRSAVLAGSGRAALPHARHAAHFAEVAAECDGMLRGADEAAGVARLASVIAEMRTAHSWARKNDAGLAARLSASLRLFAVSTLDDEVLGWAARLVPHLEAGDRRLATAHASVASRLVQSGRLPAAVARAERALEAAPDDLSRLAALEVLTDAAIYDGRLEECRRHAHRLVRLALDVGDPHYLAMAGCSLALAHAYDGDRGQAHLELDGLRSSLSHVESLSPTIHGWLAYTEGEIDLDLDPVRARSCLRRAIALADSVGNRYLGGVARVSATSAAGRRGDPLEALAAFDEVVRWWLDRGDRTHLLTTLRNMVDVLGRAGAPGAAAELLGAVDTAGLPATFGAERDLLDRAAARLERDLSRDELHEHSRVGATRSVEDAARLALEAAGRLRGR